MSSITGLGLRNKVGLGKSTDSSPKPKQQGSSITGLGLRNKAAGLTGNKKSSDQSSLDHIPTPRSALIDPSSFAPPPKNVNYHSAAATERQADRVPQKGPLTPAEYRAREEEKLNRKKEEEAIERENRRLEREEKQRLRLEQQEGGEAAGPRLPYRNDSTGLSTTQFMPPVARRDTADGTIVIRPTASSHPKPKPSLPPRLPDRQDSNSGNGSPSLPSTYGRGIGTDSQSQSSTEYIARPQLPTRIATGSTSNTPARTPDNPQLSELQSRFARMGMSSPKTENSIQETPWAEKQAALRLEAPLTDNSMLPAKKVPPPRPKKRAELSGSSVKASDISPPIPMSSKPW